MPLQSRILYSHMVASNRCLHQTYALYQPGAAAVGLLLINTGLLKFMSGGVIKLAFFWLDKLIFMNIKLCDRQK